MSSAETVSRQWDILKKIPQYPNRITARDIFEQLPSVEYEVSLRTVQRDLENLSRKFPITCDLEGRTHYWCWIKGARQLEIPRMTGSMAATLLLARDYLDSLLPGAILGELRPYFDRAEEVLSGTRLKGWNKKVRILERGPMLMPPKISDRVRDVVYQALLDGRCLKARYQARAREEVWSYVLSPLGLVARSGQFYLIATVGNYEDARHFALHRMSRAELLDDSVKVPKSFKMKSYIEDEQSFAYPLTPNKIKLEVLFDKDVAFHLSESKLSTDQTIEDLQDGWVLVKATVADTEELRWWLQGFGEMVDVIHPSGLI